MRINKSLVSTMECLVSDARTAWKALNGLFAVYKASEVTYLNARDTITHRLCQDLNSMQIRPPIKHVAIEGNTMEKMKVVVHPSYADHPLVVGPRYDPKDFKIKCVNYLSTDMSGLMVLGINDAVEWAYKLKKYPISYKLKGILGHATNNYFHTGKIVEKAAYRFIKRSTVDRICAMLQATHQRKMFELCGADMQSQAAYELAVQGLVKPEDHEIPMIYSIKCVDFTPPEFTLEVVCVNTDDMYLKTLIHELGIQLHSAATCTQIQCFRYALFDLNLALLRKHWELQDILNNIELCNNILYKNSDLLKQKRKSRIFTKQDETELGSLLN